MKYLNELKPEGLAGKRVLLRVDFNVPVPKLNRALSHTGPTVPLGQDPRRNGNVGTGTPVAEIETFRIKAHKHTLDYLVNSGAKVALVSHIKALDSFLSIVEQIGHALGQTLTLVPHSKLASLATMFQKCPVVLIDNIRQDPREEKNDDGLASDLSRGFNFFVNDAFSVCHRAHASIVAITRLLPSYAGLLIKKEIEHLTKALDAPADGKVLVLGGAKISTKLPVIKNFLDKCEKILVGGALANNFFRAQGINTGVSLTDNSTPINLATYDVTRIKLPTDILVASDKSGKSKNEIRPLGDIGENELIADIGPDTTKQFAEIISNAKMVIWNGPMGIAEMEVFAKGTNTIAEVVSRAEKSIIGGGDTVAAANRLGLLGKFTFVSTGGGAMLAFLAGEKLPGLKALEQGA